MLSLPSAPSPSAPVDAPPPSPPPPGWVDVAREIPDAVLDIRYASSNNVTGTRLYPQARCWLRKEPASQLAQAAAELRRHKRRLLLWDCYRPPRAQRALWQRIGDRRYAAEPTFDDEGRPLTGSRHSRGASVDVGLAYLDGTPVTMPTEHDAIGPDAHRAAAMKSAAAAELLLLDTAMTRARWRGLPSEWWHYDAESAAHYPLADLP